MKFIPQSELDKKRWNALVENHQADVFSCSWYLDSCAEDWCVLTDDNFENGVALPFTVKLGVKTISPPIFVRNLDFIGNDKSFAEKAMELIRKEFSAGHMQMLFPPLEEDQGRGLSHIKARIFQAVQSETKPNQQAKRMLQKALKNGISITQTTDWKTVFAIIQSELSEKISEFNTENLEKLNKLIASLEKENQLFCLGIYQNEKLEGGMIFMESAQKRVYLKGAANRTVRDLGGMYLCMNEAVNQTILQEKYFDFGGSEVEGVRRFNVNLGGTDQQYYIYSWNNAPWWFNLTKRMYQKWKKKVILLTGASGALGTQIAASLKNSGHQLILQYNENSIAAEGEDLLCIQCDLCNPDAIRQMIEASIARFGRIDVLINNAGISRSSVSWKTSAEDWYETININLNAPFFLSQAVIPFMREKQFGRIINISSVVAQTGFVGTSAYAASKAGLIGLTKTLSKELAKFQITVNAIALGYFNTGMISDVPQEAQEKLLEQVPVNALGDPAVLIKTIEFLLSGEAGFVTGQTINLNGGLYS